MANLLELAGYVQKQGELGRQRGEQSRLASLASQAYTAYKNGIRTDEVMTAMQYYYGIGGSSSGGSGGTSGASGGTYSGGTSGKTGTTTTTPSKPTSTGKTSGVGKDLPQGVDGISYSKACEMVKNAGGQLNPDGKPTVLAIRSDNTTSRSAAGEWAT